MSTPPKSLRNLFYRDAPRSVYLGRDERTDRTPRQRDITEGESLKATVRADVVERAQAGEASAERELIRELTAPLLRLARRLAGDAGVAEELVNDVLYRGLIRLKTLKKREAVLAWFSKILVHRWRDTLRRSRNQELSLDDVGEPAAPSETDPGEKASADELQQEVFAAIASLPPGQRAAMSLHLEEALSIREIAEILDSTPDNVKANIWHARKRLRTLLAAWLEPADDA